MRLYGTESCTGCKQAIKVLNENGYGMYEYINVAQIPGFVGEIPRLECDDGQIFVGLPAIVHAAREKRIILL